MNFIHSLQSEWLKTKRSAASWLCIIGGFFIPFIYLIAFLKNNTSINKYPDHIWETHFNELWHNMAIFLLPMGVILASSLITQMEFKNNTWKQLHASPQSYPTIFLSKYSVIFLMTVKFFLFFNIGLILSGLIPCSNRGWRTSERNDSNYGLPQRKCEAVYCLHADFSNTIFDQFDVQKLFGSRWNWTRRINRLNDWQCLGSIFS